MPAGAAQGKELKSVAGNILYFLFNPLQLGKGASEWNEEVHTDNCRVHEKTVFGKERLYLRVEESSKGLFLVGVTD